MERRHSYSGKPALKSVAEISSAVGLDLESAYNPSRSIYDTLSCETFERITADRTPLDRKARQKTLAEQRKLDAETFGMPHYNRYRGKGRNNNNNNNPPRNQQYQQQYQQRYQGYNSSSNYSNHPRSNVQRDPPRYTPTTNPQNNTSLVNTNQQEHSTNTPNNPPHSNPPNTQNPSSNAPPQSNKPYQNNKSSHSGNVPSRSPKKYPQKVFRPVQRNSSSATDATAKSSGQESSTTQIKE